MQPSLLWLVLLLSLIGTYCVAFDSSSKDTSPTRFAAEHVQ
jgi:hypothetical protein